MVARLLTLVAVVVSLVGFIAGETGHSDWWWYALGRAGYVLVALALVAALLSARSASVIARGAQVLAAATALAFAAVAIAKYYGDASPFGFSIRTASAWAGEAELFATAALAFALTLARRRNAVAVAGLAVAVAIAVGCGIYAFTLKANFAQYIWWLVAGIGAFLAASAAAGLERAGGLALSPSVASSPGGDAGSDPVVE